jgi:hypothetical protein
VDTPVPRESNLRRRALPSSDQNGKCSASEASDKPLDCSPRDGLNGGDMSVAEDAYGQESPGSPFLHTGSGTVCDIPLRIREIDTHMGGWIH